MKRKYVAAITIAALLVIASVSVYSQVSRPYHNGSVWTMGFIRIKPSMDTAYLNYLA